MGFPAIKGPFCGSVLDWDDSMFRLFIRPPISGNSEVLLASP